jgi:alcohol dehydrogenase
MQAAILNAFATPLEIVTLPDPTPGTGEVIVDVHATRVLAYAGDVFSGARNYLLTLPAIPGAGAIGRVRSIGPDATRLQPGDWVICDPTVRARDDAQSPDIILQGLTAASPAALKLQDYHRHGAFAEQMRLPTENVTRIGTIAPADAPSWAAATNALVPLGGMLAGALQAGETIVVNGATGAFGAAAVAVALALGAGCVIATGRNTTALADLARRHPDRLRTVAMQTDETADHQAIRAASPGPIDMVFDILPPAATAAQVRAAATTVRPNGRIVLMGGVGMQAGGGLDLPYAWLMRNNITLRGQWMYPPTTPARLAQLIRAGLLPLDRVDVTRFPLTEANAAVAHAAAHAGPFNATVLVPIDGGGQ